MFDITLRPLKDVAFDPLSRAVPKAISPMFITSLALVSGLLACTCAANGYIQLSLMFWSANRFLDCLDGAVARSRSQASDLGGFLDLLGDFIVYSLIPIACASSPSIPTMTSPESVVHLWLAVATVEASFHINNFILFYTAAVIEKRKADTFQTHKVDTDKKKIEREIEEITSVAMKPALIEGFESALLFTVMLAQPNWTRPLCWLMTALVSCGVLSRTFYLFKIL